MKFSVNQKTLERGLSFITGILEKRNPIPAGRNILIEVSDADHIKITATDLDTTLVTRVEAEVMVSGQICLPGKKLLEMVRLLPSADIFFESGGNSTQIKVECGKSRFKILGSSRREFPEEIISNGTSISLPSEVLLDFINHTSFAITEESSRFTLSGAKFELDGTTAKMITTDGHRLAYIETTLAVAVPEATNALIPRKVLRELKKICSGENAEIAFWEDANHLYFETAEQRLITRKLAVVFPNYEMVIPKDNDRLVTCSATVMLSALERVCQMADERTHAITLTVKTGEMIISAQCAEEGEASESIPVTYKGEEMVVKFQHEYVKDFINSVKDEADSRISISFRDSNSQFLFRPATENGRHCLGVIMPLRH